MSDQFQNLFTPIRIKNVDIRNRIVSTGHGTGLGENKIPGQPIIDYHVERAKGGCGLIVVEIAGVHKSTAAPLIGWDERLIPEYKKLTDAVHEHGAKISLQVGHIGRQRFFGRRLNWAPSPMPYQFYDTIGLTPKEVEIEDIKEVVEGWGRAAHITRESGFDGVEIHSLYGNYFLGAFVSPYSNKRNDEYGGSLENRMRVIYEVMDSVRKNVGDDYMVGLQLNGDDLTSGGLGPNEYKEIASLIDQRKQIDYIVVKAGTYWVPNMVIPDMQHPLGLWVPYSSGIKEVTKNAVIIAVGRINDPVFAEKVLADGHADMTGMTRAQIADPELANKTREGRLEDIRPCVACNDGCWGNIYGARFGCVHNTAAANERKLGIGTLNPADKIKNVMVIGGGPGGLKAAKIAALRGHKVSLYEKRDQFGGQVRFAAKGAGRGELEGIIRHLSIQVEKMNIETHLDTEVTPEMVKESNPDAVIVATGSIPRRKSFTGIPSFDPDIQDPVGSEQSNVLTSLDLLENEAETGRKVIVADDGEGNWKAVSIAELLFDRGKDVELVTPLEFARDLTAERRIPVLKRFLKKGIKITPYTMIREIKDKTVVLYNIYSRQETIVEDVDNVVLAYFHQANDALYFDLKGKVKELYRIGDCMAPRMIGDAIREGEKIARLL
ncbi:MAG: FAD-dependent oxidoreductase [Desulfobacteraceae bacterium]|nr:FAD-dependent oxidoreductase [Desulfobacteraceae bacterium]